MGLSILQRLKKQRSRQDRIVPKSALSDNVFNTYELLANIFEFLSPRDLRRAERVSRFWNTVVHQSRSLRAFRTSDLQQSNRNVSLLLLGEDGVGKKSLATTWMKEVMLSAYSLYHREMVLRRAITFESETWDTTLSNYGPSALSNPQSVTRLLCDSHGYALVYSVTSRHSFERARAIATCINMIDDAALHCPDPPRTYRSPRLSPSSQHRTILRRPLVLIANKCDFHSLLHGWDVTQEEGMSLARDLGCAFHETSAKSGDGVDDAFAEILKQYKAARIDQLVAKAAVVTASRPVMRSGLERRDSRVRVWLRNSHQRLSASAA